MKEIKEYKISKDTPKPNHRHYWVLHNTFGYRICGCGAIKIGSVVTFPTKFDKRFLSRTPLKES